MNIMRRVMWSQTVNNSKDKIYDAHIRFDDILHRNSIKIAAMKEGDDKYENYFMENRQTFLIFLLGFHISSFTALH